MFTLLNFSFQVFAQTTSNSFSLASDVKITIDAPAKLNCKNPLWLIWYALPNGNTTAQAMGKKMLPGHDWDFDIKHIAVQTAFTRHTVKNTDIVVVNAENDLKSWPAWKNIMRTMQRLSGT